MAVESVMTFDTSRREGDRYLFLEILISVKMHAQKYDLRLREPKTREDPRGLLPIAIPIRSHKPSLGVPGRH